MPPPPAATVATPLKKLDLKASWREQNHRALGTFINNNCTNIKSLHRWNTSLMKSNSKKSRQKSQLTERQKTIFLIGRKCRFI